MNFLDSCKKTSPAVQPVAITGQWNWIRTYPSGNPSSYLHYPLTPANEGFIEVLSFNENGQFTQTINDSIIQSGTYITGHGTDYAYGVDQPNSFDSIAYLVNGSKLNVDYYKILHNDTLVFSGSFAGLVGGGSKYFVK